MNNPKYNINEWVSFYKDGRIIISEIRYVSKDILGHWVYSTNLGRVQEDSILEARK